MAGLKKVEVKRGRKSTAKAAALKANAAKKKGKKVAAPKKKRKQKVAAPKKKKVTTPQKVATPLRVDSPTKLNPNIAEKARRALF
jgi:hypothetical protein